MTVIKKGFSALVTLTIPVIISVLSIHILLSPIFTNLEYRRPGFPEDNYGFTTAERLEFGNQTRSYLISNDTLDDLQQLVFENGDPIYIERELTHLEDVKIVLQGVLRVFYGAAAGFVLGGLIARTRGWQEIYLNAIYLGGKITAGLLVMILLLTLVSFQALFTNFHLLFFEGGSWLFFYSDTLIRLFPVQFWQDIFLVFGILTLAGGILLGWVLPARMKNIPENDGRG
ncbi:MAG: TIGR01906 family membrane protein [Anaerolineales bacterium]|nr:TIGR01906 family membrane protein [Anaerolineales bacterium]